MKFKLSILPILYLIILLCLNSSCGHKYYAPNDADLVVLKKKHDVHLSGTTDIGSKSKQSSNVQLGYSPIKHLGFAGSYFKYNQWKKTQNPPVRGNGKIWNAAIGAYFFQPLISKGLSKRDSKRSKKILRNQHLFHPAGILMDIYFGRSKGSVNNLYDTGGMTQLKFQKNYIQFGIHWTSKSIGFDLATLIGKLNYSEAIISGKPSSSSSYVIDYLESNNNFNLLEHSFRLNFGFNHIRLVLSVSGISQSAKLNQLGVVEAVTTFGMIIEIDEFLRKNKKEGIEKNIDF